MKLIKGIWSVTLRCFLHFILSFIFCLICIFVYAHAIMTLTAPDILLFAELFYFETPPLQKKREKRRRRKLFLLWNFCPAADRMGERDPGRGSRKEGARGRRQGRSAIESGGQIEAAHSCPLSRHAFSFSPARREKERRKPRHCCEPVYKRWIPLEDTIM